MAKSANQKLKILYILQYLMQKSDEAHPVTEKQIENELLLHGISAERKSIYSDINVLQSFGVDIIKNKNSYYVGSREFELPELKLLVDSVQSSKFITEKKTISLIKKIESLASVYDAQLLQRQVFVRNRVKSMNESVYYNVDEISGAISEDKTIRFKYFDYTVTRERRFRKEGEWYEVSPFSLMWADENYYMIAYDSAAKMLKHYRVDRMTSISATEHERDGREEYKGTDMAEYSKRVFGMFTGEVKKVTMRFNNELTGAVIDRFGIDTVLVPHDEHSFTVSASVAVSPPFFGWMFAFGRSAEILSPQDVKDEYRRRIEEMM